MINCQQRQALMLLSSSLPPQFLLPAWSTPQLMRQFQQYRANYSTWDDEREKAERGYKAVQQRRNHFRDEMDIDQAVDSPKPLVKVTDRRSAIWRPFKTAVPDGQSSTSGIKPFKNTIRQRRRPLANPVWRPDQEKNVDTTELLTNRHSETGLRKEDVQQTHTTWNSIEDKEGISSGTANIQPTSRSVDLKRWMEDDRQPDSNKPWTTQPSETTNKQTAIQWKPIEKKRFLSPEPEPEPEPERELSLFEELFPEETEKEAAEKKKAQEGWFPISDIPTKDSGFPSLDDVQRLSERLSQRPKRRRRDSLHGSSDVLLLSCASKNLEESDFLRINPKGTHIEGWASGMMKVIPGRNPHTLARNGSYILIFPSPYHAEAYRDSLINAHRNAQVHTPQSLYSPLPPPATQHHAKNAELLKIYTLFPPSQQQISITKPKHPFYSENLQRIVSEGGYPPILRASETDTGQKAGLILFSILPPVEGLRSFSGLKSFLERDGRARNLAWRLAGDMETAITKVISPDPETKNSWIVSFKDRNEARRFVRVWHRRELRMSFKELDARKWKDEGFAGVVDEEPVVTAEVLW